MAIGVFVGSQSYTFVDEHHGKTTRHSAMKQLKSCQESMQIEVSYELCVLLVHGNGSINGVTLPTEAIEEY
jgi:hypothetical protein